MEKPIAYLFRGERFWMLSLGGIPEGDELRDSPPGSNPDITPTAFSREADVELVLRAVRAANSGHDIRVLNWHRPKRDFTP